VICAHCEQPIDAGDEMTLHGCSSSAEIVCERCWFNAVLPYDCWQCFAEVIA
jgi:hypothetical protein